MTQLDLAAVDASKIITAEPSTATGARTQRDRVVSVDIFRGVTIAAMVFVNNPAVGPPYLYKQLTHAVWRGWTFADTIFPAFVVLIGVSAALGPKPRSVGRACRRDLVLFGAGLALNAAPLVLAGQGATSVVSHLRIMGVLQRIAVADFAATLAMIWLRPRNQLLLAAALFSGYWALLAHVGVPGHPAGLLTPAVNLPGWIDRQVLGVAHMYPAAGGRYDPEGLLGCISTTAAILLGAAIGRMLLPRNSSAWPAAAWPAAARLAVAGAAMTIAGWAWSADLPIVKRLWTPSYVVLMCGLTTLALALTHAVFTPGRGPARAVGWPWRVLGANALVVYVGTEITGAVLGALEHPMPRIPHAPFTYWVWWRWLAPVLGPWRGNVAWAALILAAWWLIAVFLWQRRILVRA